MLKTLFKQLKATIRTFIWLSNHPGFSMERQNESILIKAAKNRQKLVNIGAKVAYDTDGLATMHNADFIQHPRFATAYAAGKATDSWGPKDIQWRAYVCCWAADIASHLPGDFVECGVNRGGYSRAIIDYVNFQQLDKTFYLLDTFQGLDESRMSDDEKKRHDPTMGGRYTDCYQAVCDTFKAFNTRIIQGTVPDTLPQVDTTQVAFLSIDMNCAEPEIAAIHYFWDKLVPGAMVVLDDYAWVSHLPQKEAFDAFATEKNIPILALPTGQGLLMKPTANSSASAKAS